MQQPAASPKPLGRPPRISREEIIGTAARIVENEGVAKLTMRRLATEIGSTPMALYHHVRNKEQLLLLLMDDYAARILRRPELPEEPQEQVIVAAATIHDGLTSCPWIVEVLTADDLMSKAALWFVEQIVDGLVRCGLSPEQAVHGYRTIWYYTAGEILIRKTAAVRREQDDGKPTFRDQVFGELDPAEVPRLAAVAGQWASLTAEDTYLPGLRALVSGLVAAG